MSARLHRLPAMLATVMLLLTACDGDERPSRLSYAPSGPPHDLGSGVVVGVSADGTAALVSDRNPRSDETGCEGLPAQFLFRVPLDGGPRRLAAREPISGRLVRSPDRSQVAIVRDCEEYFDALFVGRELSGGRLAQVRQVEPKTGLQLSPFIVSWSADGRSLIAVGAKDFGGDERREVVSIDVVTGAVETLRAASGVIRAAQLGDGTLVVLRQDGLLVGDRLQSVRAFGLAVAPDRKRVAVFGEGGITVGAPGQAPIRLVRTPVDSSTWSPDSRAIAYSTRHALRVVTTGRMIHDVATKGRYGASFFVPDGSALVFNRFERGVEGYGELFVSAVRFGRSTDFGHRSDRVYVRDPLSRALRFKPRAIHFKDADFTRLRWSSWGTSTARGRGWASVLSCRPSCAEGRIHRGRVRLVLTKLRNERGRRVYQCIAGRVSDVPPDVRRVQYCAP